MKKEEIADFFASRILEAEQSGFSLLRRIPASERIRFITYYSSLDADGRALFRHSLGFRSAAWFGYPIDRSEDCDLLAPVSRYAAWCAAHAGDWQTQSYRDLRFLRHVLVEEPDHTLVAGLPSEARRRIMTIETAKASELRKVARLAFRQLLGAKPENDGGGVWRYAGKIGDEAACVELDSGSMMAQLRYQVHLQKFSDWQPNEGPTYEALHGYGHGWWDQIEEGQEDETIALLVDLVKEVVSVSLTIGKQRIG